MTDNMFDIIDHLATIARTAWEQSKNNPSQPDVVVFPTGQYCIITYDEDSEMKCEIIK